jgi:LL-diaminopimelate aminotransferase
MKMENQTCRIKPADRLASVSEYYFSKKLKEVAQMNAEGMDVISLGIGSPDMPPSEKTIRTLCEAACNPDGHGYMPYVGIPELRRGFADWYKKWYGVALNPNTEIQPLIGSKEGILHVTLAFVNPGEQVLVPNPGYPTYTSLSKILGAEVVNYNLKEENGWMPDFDELERMDMSRVKLMWTNYPNMPTGANATPELYRKLVDFARRKDIVIVNDNPYSFILNEHPQHSGCQRVLHRIQFHEQKPQHAGMAYRHACLECRLRAMDIESKEQHRQRYVPCHATGSRHCPGSRARLV